MSDVEKALAYFKDEEPETYSSWGMGAILARRVAELEDILKTQVDVSRQHEAAAARLERRVAELEGRLERERRARKAVEQLNADEVLAKRTNLEALIASETARAKAAEARVAELEAALRDGAVLLRKTIYNVPDWSGPDVWWKPEADELLARIDALAKDGGGA